MRKQILMLIALMFVVTIITACQSQVTPTAPDAPLAKDTLIIAVDREPVTLNPHGSNDNGTHFVNNLIFERLVTLDNDMNLIPVLATTWEFIDDTTIRFNLREDVKFHNGDPFTAEDVKYTFEQTSESPHATALLGFIDAEATRVVSDHVVDVVLKYPFAPALRHLAHPVAAIVRKNTIEAGGDPVGTGPFQFVDWATGDRLNVKAFDGYWGDKVRFENLLIRYIPEATTRAIEVETGGVDIARGITPSAAIEFMENPDVKVYSTNTLDPRYLSFNCSKAPFDNVKVRQAISAAIDAETIVETVTFGLGQRSYSVVTPNVFGYHNAGDPFGYNVERAKALLDEAGYPDGFTTTLVINAALASDDAEIIQNMLGQIGINVEILSYDFSNWLDTIVNGRQDMYIGLWTAVTGDADYAIRLAYHSENKGPGGNRSFYSNEKVDALLEAAKVEMDQSVRLELYKEVQEILAEEAVVVNLQIGQLHDVAGKHVKGLVPHPNQTIGLWTVYFE